MKLLRFGEHQWTVYGYCQIDGRCPVLEVMMDLGGDNIAVGRLLQKLRRTIPERGARSLNGELAKKINGYPNLFEFREQPRKGPKVRVLFFRDGIDVVVCTVAFVKRGESHDAEFKLADECRKEYLKRKSEESLIVIDIEDWK